MFDVSQGLREQIINIVDDLVGRIAPGYLPPNRILFRGYQEQIYNRVYKFLWDELGMRRFENINYRDEIFDHLRNVSSEKFFNDIEYLLKAVYWIVHIQITVPDDIILNPHGGEKLWSRKESVRDRHISLFKQSMDKLNYRLSQHNAKYRYELRGESVQMVRVNTGLDVPKEKSDIQKQDNNQPPERQKKNNNQSSEPHQNQSHSEIWNRRNYIIAVVLLILTALGVFFGNGILIPPLRWVWNYLQTILNR